MSIHLGSVTCDRAPLRPFSECGHDLCLGLSYDHQSKLPGHAHNDQQSLLEALRQSIDNTRVVQPQKDFTTSTSLALLPFPSVTIHSTSATITSSSLRTRRRRRPRVLEQRYFCCGARSHVLPDSLGHIEPIQKGARSIVHLHARAL